MLVVLCQQTCTLELVLCWLGVAPSAAPATLDASDRSRPSSEPLMDFRLWNLPLLACSSSLTPIWARAT